MTELLVCLAWQLTKFHTDDQGRPILAKNVRVVGFRENVFTDADGIVADSGALNEYVFGTIVKWREDKEETSCTAFNFAQVPLKRQGGLSGERMGMDALGTRATGAGRLLCLYVRARRAEACHSRAHGGIGARDMWVARCYVGTNKIIK